MRGSTPQLQEHIKTHMDSNNEPKTTFRNKMIQRMQLGSATYRSNGIRLRNSFYNDENLEYLTRSNIMLKSSRSYKDKKLSHTTRKKMDTEKCEEVMMKKRDSSFYSVKSQGRLSVRSTHHNAKETLKRTLASQSKLPPKFNNTAKINQKVLLNYIDTKMQLNKNSDVKWFSSFKNRSRVENRYAGQSLHSQKKLQNTADQIKVLNIDRLFKGNHKTGLKAVPLPKQTPPKTKNQESKGITLNTLIKDYNNLCKIDQILKVRKGKNYIQGKTFVQQPTLQQILGVKAKIMAISKPNTTSSMSTQAIQNLQPGVFEQYCSYYRNNIRKQPYLKERFMEGLKCGQKSLTFQSYLHFHELFVSRAASSKVKLQFLQYFFIPSSSDSITLQMFRLLMEMLCQRLPEASSIQIHWRKGFDIPNEDKTKIFYETLMRVLVGEVEDRLKEVGLINRDVIRWIFGRNDDSMNLILLLFYDKGKLASTFSQTSRSSIRP